MKLDSVNKKIHKKTQAFTLIEMIGVLAVIAILAAMLIPRVFEAINSARVNNTAVSCESAKAAAADHYGRYGKFDTIFGTNQLTAAQFVNGIYTGYDTNVLMAEGLMDKPFSVRIAGGDPSKNTALLLSQGGKDNGGLGYKLDGQNNATSGAQLVLEAIIMNVAAADAKDLNDRIDGGSLGAPDLLTADTKGRVEYAAPDANTRTTTVYVYLTHR